MIIVFIMMMTLLTFFRPRCDYGDYDDDDGDYDKG